MSRGNDPAHPSMRQGGMRQTSNSCGGTVEFDPYLAYMVGGLTIREAFVMAAMQGLLANPAYSTTGSDEISGMAIHQANDTLAALEKGDGSL